MRWHNGLFIHLAGMLDARALAAAMLVATTALLAGHAHAAAFCTQEYAPVCAEAKGQRQTFSNACFARAAGARIVHRGACGRKVEGKGSCARPANPADDTSCKSWTDGCNICRRARPGGPATCTKMACRTTTAPRCLLRFGERP